VAPLFFFRLVREEESGAFFLKRQTSKNEKPFKFLYFKNCKLYGCHKFKLLNLLINIKNNSWHIHCFIQGYPLQIEGLSVEDL